MIELNELIYAGAKLTFDKIGKPLRNPIRNTKPEWEIKLQGQIKKLLHQAKAQRNEKHTHTQPIYSLL